MRWKKRARTHRGWRIIVGIVPHECSKCGYMFWLEGGLKEVDPMGCPDGGYINTFMCKRCGREL